MPKLVVTGKNVCGAPSRFILDGFVEKTKSIVGPDGSVLIELDGENLEHVVRLQVESVDAGAEFREEGEFEAEDLRKAQWAAHPKLRGRFLLTSLTWGEHELLAKPGVV